MSRTLTITSIMLFALSCAKAQGDRIKLKKFFDARFSRPVDVLQHPQNKNIFFVVEQIGVVKVIDRRSGKISVALDIRDRVRYGGEMGLFDIEFPPQNTKIIFLSYTSRKMHSVVSAMRVENLRIDKNSEVVLLRVRQPYSNHNGGDIEFGPDGYLYIALGDGGGAGDPLNHGQNTSTPLGAILRIDVSDVIKSMTPSYRIPPDNPFAGKTCKTGGCPEIFAWGLRNPWRMSFDSKGNLWVGDVGQDRWEEINIVRKGKNYGWRCFEGYEEFNMKGCRKDRSAYEFPVTVYATGKEGCAVIGGYVYEGGSIKMLEGLYVFGDWCSGKIWAFDPRTRRTHLLAKTDLMISSFAKVVVDGKNEILVIDHKGGYIFILTE